MVKDYGNCSGFKLLNENEEFYKQYNEPTAEKDYRSLMMMSTPPSNTNKTNKYLMVSTQNGLFSCTPKDDTMKHSKEEPLK